MAIAEIQHEVARWPARDRGTLAAWLLDSLPPHSGEDAADEGLAEAARRRDELNAGTVSPMSAEEFWASIEQYRSSWK